MKQSFYSPEELQHIGFRSFGNHCLVSRNASLFTPEKISLGSHVRIDDFCILSGDISIGSYVHISAYTALYGKNGIEVDDFVTLSGRVLVYSQNDDYSGTYMTNPMVPEEFTGVTGERVIFRKHSIVAAGCIILPGVIMEEGSCAGAMSLVKNNLEAWKIYAGIPARYIQDRKRNIMELEKELLKKAGGIK